ncbi:flagellar basal body L-ring protein FlgH [Bythopirellula polymerisocia]|uniref:Flagellar L-ring protein n=1 Tax=Bythopirellula polymerisocia TaxID=2528003 RepID=A0A5C6CLQ8_9BACT|nr:flagellar basal body L-ring protein FlgH [Bythopirellula polymerisocia]TWU25550.1 Flagellar L-ring protein precursor [Bythopirellula polymerisocia]
MIYLKPQFAHSFAVLFALLAIDTSADWASAQDGSLYLQPSQGRDGLTLEDSSFMYQELPPESLPRKLQLHSIITVLVDVRSRFLSEGDAQNRKTQSLTAVLADWIRLENGSLKPAPQNDGDPRVAGTLNSQYRVQSDVELLDSLAFRMAVEIVDIQPNGNLVIEGHQTINNNEEQWRISLSGVVRREAIQADNTVSSDAIYDLSIDKEEMGQVRDAYARGWFSKWYDRYKPF